MYKIYKYTNKIDGKIYIGQTKMSLEQRAMNGHNYKGSTYFYNAIQRYGWESFKGEILEEVDTVEMANEREKYYISLFNSTSPEYGYNITSGGWNCELSDDTKKILSDKAKERYKDKTKNPMYGKTHNKDAIEKMKNAKIGENNPMYGKHLSEETKLKISESHKGKKIDNSYWTEGYRKEKSISMKKYAKENGWSKRVLCVEDNIEFGSVTDAAKCYNVAIGTLSGHLNGKQKTCRNKHFVYIS